MAAGDAEKKDKEKKRRPGLRIEVKGPGGFLVLGGAVILAGFGAAWAANRAPAKDRRKKGIDKKEASNKGESGQRNDGEEKTRSGIPSPLLLSSPEIVDLRHEKLSMEVKRMGIQENKFIYEIKQNPKICMVTEENHLEANIIGDGVKDFSLDGDESNMPEYSKEPIAEGLRSIDVQGAVEESEGGEEVEEKSPSVEYDKKDSSLDGDESSKPEFSKEPIAEGLSSVEVKGAVEESEGGEKIEEALSVESDMKDFSLKGDESNIPEYSKKPVAEGSRSVDVKGTVEESECGEKIEEEAPSLEYDMKDSSLDGDESNMPEFSKEPIVERSRLVDVKGLEEESEGGEKTVAAAAAPSVEYDMKDSSLDDDESNMLEYTKEPIAEGLRSADVKRTVEESEGGKEIEEEAPLVESNKKDFLLDSDKSNMPKFSKEPTAEGLRSVDVQGAVEENDSSEDIEERAPSVKSDTKDFSLDGDVSNMPYSKKPIAEGLRSIDVQGAVEESKGGEEIEEEEEAPLVQSDMKEFSLDGDECSMSAYSQEPIIEGFRSIDVNGAVEESEGGEKIETAAAPSVEYDMKGSSLDGDESNILEYLKEPIAEGFRSADVKRAVEESEGGKEIEEEALSVECDKKDFLLDNDESNMLKFSKEPTAEGLRSVDVQGAVEENDGSEDIEQAAPSVESDTKDFSLDGDVSNMPYSKKPIAEGLRSIDVQGAVEESKGGEELEDALSAESDKKDFSLDGDELNMPEYLKQPIVEGTRSIEVQGAVEESKGGEEIEEEEEAPLVQSDMKEFSLDGDECSVSAYSQEPIIEGFRSIDINGVVEESEGGEKIETAKAPSVEYDIKDSSLHGDESNMLEYSKEPIAEGWRSADVKRAIEESEGGKEIEEEAPLVESDKKDFLLDSDESNMPEFPKEPLAEGLRSVDIQGAVEENDGSEDIEEQAPLVESVTKDFSLDGDVSNMPEYSKEPIAEGSRSIDVQGAVEESKGGEEFEEALSAESDKKDFQLDGDELNMPEYLKEPIVEGSRSIDVQGAVEESKCGERKEEEEEEEEAPLVQSDMKEFSLDGDECNMSAYSQEPIIEELRSIDVNGAVEESQGGEEIEEEAPSVESEEEGIESSIKEDESDGTAASSVESNTNVFWPAEMLEKEESLPPPESIKMKNNSVIHEEIKQIVDAAREAEIVEEYEEKGPILDEREAIAAGNMKTIRLTTTMIMGKEMDITSISHSKVFLLMLILALSVGLLSFTHHHHLSALYEQFCQLIFPVKNDTL